MNKENIKKEMDAATKEELEILQNHFSKERLLTYLFVIILPPYALYRIHSEKSDFARSEKVVWTMIILLYLYQLIKTLLF